MVVGGALVSSRIQTHRIGNALRVEARPLDGPCAGRGQYASVAVAGQTRSGHLF